MVKRKSHIYRSIISCGLLLILSLKIVLSQDQVKPLNDFAGWNTAKASMSDCRFGHSSFTYNGRIYIFGGMDFNLEAEKIEYFDYFSIYDPNLDQWESLVSSPILQRCNLMIAKAEEKVFVMGGTAYTEGELMYMFKSVDVYDPATNTWQSRANYPGKGIGNICVIDGMIYSAGGHDENYTPLSEAYKYDIKKDVWTRIADLHIARFTHTVQALNGKVYAIGGIANLVSLEPGLGIRSVEVYDPDTDTWSEGTPLPFPLCLIRQQLVYNGEIYVVGGQENVTPYEGKTCMLKYNPVLDDWIEFGVLPSGRSQHTIQVVDEKLYLFGGYETSVYEPDSNTWEYDLQTSGIRKKFGETPGIYPNPITESLHIEASGSGEFHIRLCTAYGYIVLEDDFSGSSKILDTSHLQRGMYVLILSSTDEVWTEKLIKM